MGLAVTKVNNRIVVGNGADLVSWKQVRNRSVRVRFTLALQPRLKSSFLSLFSLHRAMVDACRSIRRSADPEPKRDDSSRSKVANSCWRTEFFRMALAKCRNPPR